MGMFESWPIQSGFSIHPYVPVTTWLIVLAVVTTTNDSHDDVFISKQFF